MKPEDKELLLKDLCSRLPYNVKVEYKGTTLTNIFDVLGIAHGRIMLCLPFMSQTECPLIEEVKPYLFPLSSMTEEQKKEMSSFDPFKTEEVKTFGDWAVRLVDFYNKYHLDFRGLIQKGLANDATNLNIY